MRLRIGNKIMNHEHDYVNHFYRKYEGRVAIGVGYNQDLKIIESV